MGSTVTMLSTVLRKEHKNDWERRVALSPKTLKQLIAQGLKFQVERSVKRIFNDDEYHAVGASLVNETASSELVLGIKEPPIDSVQLNQVHLCFSHTIKGQAYNMPLLQQFLDHKATLIDYELMKDSDGIRTVAFGRYAGFAGAIECLWAYGQKQPDSGLESVKRAWMYETVDVAKLALSKLKQTMRQPILVMILGTGKVGQGAQEVCDCLGLKQVSFRELAETDFEARQPSYCLVGTEDIFCRLSDGGFNRSEYIEYGKQRYKSRFTEIMGKVNIVLQSSFWTDHYPRHLEIEDMQRMESLLPSVLGDISCDIEGSFACTVKASDIDNPVFSFHPDSGRVIDGIHPNMMSIMSIDNLPCEFSQDASEHFSSVLMDLMPPLMAIDFSQSYEQLQLPEELKQAFIVYRGQLTPDFTYLKDYLTQ